MEPEYQNPVVGAMCFHHPERAATSSAPLGDPAFGPFVAVCEECKLQAMQAMSERRP